MSNKIQIEKSERSFCGTVTWRMRTAKEELVEHLSRNTGCFQETARILVARGVSGIKAFRDFLHPSIQDLPHPDKMKDLEKASARIAEAMERGEKIIIFGDYDADGVTSAVLLHSFLARFYPNVSFYLPHREKEGYGLKPGQVTAFAKKGIHLIITVDCGIASHDAVEEARKNGIDVVITDHHKPGKILPDACAVVNPGQEDCDSGLDYLAGVGVAFYLVMAIRKALRERGFWQRNSEPKLILESDLVALGTVTDLVPLTGINRVLVRTGLVRIRENPRPGVEALCQVAKISHKDMDSEQIAYKIGPRINAAGRMAHAEIAARLLLAPTLEAALPFALELDRLNAARQMEENHIVLEIESLMARKSELVLRDILVFQGADWPLGTIGIAASRLAKRFHKPVLLISVRHGRGFASGRSIPGFDLYLALEHCKNFLEQFGGHSMAAGFQILPKNIDAFVDSICEFAVPFRQIIGSHPPLLVDAPLSLDTLSPKLLDELEKIGPFGVGNPIPLFVAENLDVMHAKILGKDERHRRLVLRDPKCSNGKTVSAVLFQTKKEVSLPKRFSTCIFQVHRAWKKPKDAELQIEAWEGQHGQK